jgi:hypothetical protein
MKNAVFLDKIAPAETGISEEYIAFIIKVERIRELGTILAETTSS